MNLPARLRSALAKPVLPVLFFFAGVTYDSLTLTRIDRLLDNLILLLYLSLLGLLIILTGQADLARRAAGDPAREEGASYLAARVRPLAPMAIQFLLGGLFSAYAVFYSHSASWSSTAVYFFILVGLLVGNEFLHDRLTNLKLLVALYAVVCLSFFTYFLPVLTGVMNTGVFLLGALLSAGVALKVVELVYCQAPHRPRRERWLAGAPAVAVVMVLVGFYFLNWIPPVPLSLKFGGAYRQVARATDGTWELTFERGPWYRFWKRADDRLPAGAPVYCFTAVFAPIALQTTIYHHWQHRSAGRDGRFVTTDRIAIPISGGREDGYRGFSVKQRAMPGDWRVDVETSDGRLIGRVTFTVSESPDGVPELARISR
ncbi:DUF2914 domain-containing protein [Nitrospira sp. Kam-Ns4a]